MIYLYRRGNGNDGNFARHFVDLTDHDVHEALKALVVNDYIGGSKTRKHITANIAVDGEAEYGLSAYVSEGPKGETEFGAAWITAELQVVTADYIANSRLLTYSLRDMLDLAAWRYYLKESRK